MQKIDLVRTYLASGWCSSSADMKKPWMDGCPPRLMSEGVRLGLDMKLARIGHTWRISYSG